VAAAADRDTGKPLQLADAREAACEVQPRRSVQLRGRGAAARVPTEDAARAVVAPLPTEAAARACRDPSSHPRSSDVPAAVAAEGEGEKAGEEEENARKLTAGSNRADEDRK
jgi:hypothetical protein